MKLFTRAPKAPSASTINSLVGAKTTVTGDVNFEGGLRVEGTITGNVVGVGDLSMLVLVKGGRINGSIKSSHAIIDGPIDGPLVICDTLDLLPNTEINGDITYHSLTVKAGAKVTGKLIHQVWPNPIQTTTPGFE